MLRSCGVALNKRVASRAHSAVKKTSHHTLHTKKLRTHKRATHQNPSHTCHMTTRLQVTQHPPTHDSRQPPLIRDREPSLIRADPRASVGSVAVVRGWRTPSSAQASRPRTRCVVLGRDARPTSSADLCRLAAGGGRTWPSHHPPPPTSWWARGCRPRLDPPCLLQVGGKSRSMLARPTCPMTWLSQYMHMTCQLLINQSSCVQPDGQCAFPRTSTGIMRTSSLPVVMQNSSTQYIRCGVIVTRSAVVLLASFQFWMAFAALWLQYPKYPRCCHLCLLALCMFFALVNKIHGSREANCPRVGCLPRIIRVTSECRVCIKMH